MRNLSIKMSLAASDIKRAAEKFAEEKGEFAIGSIAGIAIALIITAFILIPGLRNFASSIITTLNSWWSGTVQPAIFPNT